MKSFRNNIKQLRDSVIPVLYMPQGAAAHGLYKLLSTRFDRELRAVRAGIRSHHILKKSGHERFSLRRHVHMIEKGLSMQPRRATFAADYIEETVKSFEHYTMYADNGPEANWMGSVLSDYFVATAASTHPAIIRARGAFRAVCDFEAPRAEQGNSARPVGTVETPVDIKDLAKLAHGRTSVRWYTPVHVPREHVDRAIDLAMEAPSACNRVPWELRIFDNPEDASRVAGLALGTRGWNHQVSHLAVLIGNLAAYENERDRHLIYIDGSLAAMSFVLGLQAQNISSCCINWPDVPAQEKKMSEALTLQKHERVIMLIAYGYADPNGMTPHSGKVQLNGVRRFS